MSERVPDVVNWERLLEKLRARFPALVMEMQVRDLRTLTGPKVTRTRHVQAALVVADALTTSVREYARHSNGGCSMRLASIIVMSVMFATARPLAQQTTGDDTAEELRKANRKITIGLALMGAGALAAPLTALNRRQGDTRGPAMNASIGMIFVGSGVAWWGATERRRALQPQIAIGVDVGRTLGFHFRRTW